MIYLFKITWLSDSIASGLDAWIEQNKDITKIIYSEWEAPGMPGWNRKERTALQVNNEEAALYCMLKFNLELY